MIEVKDLTFSNNGITILKNVNFKLKKNELLIIHGNIGSGKTTLFRILIGFYTSFKGSILVDGKNIQSIKIHEYFSFVEQNNDYQLLSLKVKNELELFTNGVLNEKIINHFEIQPLLNRNPHTLSSSEKRRVLLTGALSSQSEYLLLDEPTADLDDYFTEKFIQIIKKEKRGVIIFTHDKKFNPDILISATFMELN